MEKSDFHILLERYLTDDLSSAERQELAALIDLPENQSILENFVENIMVSDNYADDNNPEVKERLYSFLNNSVPGVFDLPVAAPTAHRIHFLKTSWFRYAAAILLLAGGSTAWWLAKTPAPVATTNGNKHLQTDIAPGGDKAVLTLADGTKIVLDNAQNGNLAQQGGTKIIKLDAGQLAYNTGNPPGSLYKGELGKEVLYNTISTPKGGQYQIVLPDGTKVWLNAASSIKFPTAFSANTREVEMTGEVYMEIAKNSKQPFLVKANGTEVQVLGTSFNINAYTDENAIKTTLVEGSVQVVLPSTRSGEGSGVRLKPGQQAVVEARVGKPAPAENIKVQTADMDQTLAWKNGLFSFSGADINTIMRQLSRWYDVDVQYEGAVPERHFLGEMRRSMSLAAVLRVLERSNVHFSVEGKKIIVKP